MDDEQMLTLGACLKTSNACTQKAIGPELITVDDIKMGIQSENKTAPKISVWVHQWAHAADPSAARDY